MGTQAFEFDVTLLGAEPAPWRRIQLPADATFLDLHLAIQDACGWESDHLWRFSDRNCRALAGIPFDDPIGDPDPDASTVVLSSYYPRGGSCEYLYDFGDSWAHEVALTKTLDVEQPFGRRLVDGELAFPPEDCGGLWGYEECVRIARHGPEDEQDEDRLEWLGAWDPDAFDLAAERERFDS